MLFPNGYGRFVRVRDEGGEWCEVYCSLAASNRIIIHGAVSRQAIELLLLRDRMRDWRFYDQLCMDSDAPARWSQTITNTLMLDTVADLATAIQSILGIDDHEVLAATIDDAFPCANLETSKAGGYFGTGCGAEHPATFAENSGMIRQNTTLSPADHHGRSN